MFADQFSNPVGVISTISQEHCSRLQTPQELGCKPVVVGFAGCEREPDWPPVAVDHRMNPAGQPAPWTAHGLPLVSGETCTVLVHAHDRRVDHLDGGIMGGSERVNDPAPEPGTTPAYKAVVASGAGTERDR